MIGEQQFAAIEAIDASGSSFAKYFTGARDWFRRAHQRSIALGLDKWPKRWILDVGTTVPYFAVAADLFGHNVLSVGPPDRLLARTAEILGCDYIPHQITHQRPLPKLPHRFDIVTSFGVNLKHGDRYVNLKQFGEVLDELVRCLNPGGQIVLAPNRGWLGDRWRLVSRWRKVMRARCRITNHGDWLRFGLK